MIPIRKAAVLGAGVMGSGIAAHLANASIPTVLLDIVPPQPPPEGVDPASPAFRNTFAAKGLEAASKAQPAAFASSDRVRFVTVGNFEDDLEALRDVDWVVEAVVERLDLKLALFAKIAPYLKPGAVLTTNTSGLSIEAMAAGLPEGLAHRFFGTHFFNPPRYMHLLELIPAKATDPALLKGFSDFAETRLGKGVVIASDNPNFVANRVGVFGMMTTLKAMERHGLDPETVDLLTGKPFGRPKTATFGTADLVGLDILAHVAQTQKEGTKDEAERELCTMPPWVEKMLAEKKLGLKTGGGFFKRVKENGEKKTLTLDPSTGEYREKRKPKLPVLEELKEVADPGKRLAVLLKAKGPAGDFCREITAATFHFAASKVGEICRDVASLDAAMRWGFAWETGPFEAWDAVGVAKIAEIIKAQGLLLPKAVEALIASPTPSFYLKEGETTKIWDFETLTHVELPKRKGVTVLADLSRAGRVLEKNGEASLIDLGDRVACVEFHSKMNSIGGGILSMLAKGLQGAGDRYDALVIGNQGENFSVGANLMLLLFEALEGNLEEIDLMVRAFQKSTMSLKYAPIPVVAAPFGRVFGGGAEIVLHSHRVQASLETYMGLVEVGVGLIPAGGGTKELLLRAMAKCPARDTDPLPFVKKVFETIGMAKVGLSAQEAFDLGFLRQGDRISMNQERLIHDAKMAALEMLETGWQPLKAPETVRVMGEDGMANIRMVLEIMKEGRYISEHDAKISEKLGRILCGGEVDAGSTADEYQLLDLERRAFVELCAERKTLERIRHTLQTGKPLRN